jgi:signal transduction histidine kinase
VLQVESEIDDIFRILLTAVTAEEGLGFNRGMVLLKEDASFQLRGLLAIGPETRFEAEQIWKNFPKSSAGQPDDEDRLGMLMDKAIQHGRSCRNKTEDDSRLSRAIQHIVVPLGGEINSCVKRCFVQKCTITASLGNPDAFATAIATISGEPSGTYIAVPIVGDEGVSGVLVVDSMFSQPKESMNRWQVQAWQLNSLEALANIGGISLQNLRLRESVAKRKEIQIWKEVAARVAHRIISRISAIAGTVRQLRDELRRRALSGVADETIAPLEAQISRAKALVGELRRFAIASEQHFRNVDLVSLLKSVVEDVQPGLEFMVHCSFERGELLVRGDAPTLADAFLELFSNADYAMRAAGVCNPTVKVELSTVWRHGSPGDVKIDVIDNGPGVKPDMKEEIFEARHTSKNDEGTGLGLAIVRSIVTEHGGTVYEAGTYGSGARFIIILPLVV